MTATIPGGGTSDRVRPALARRLTLPLVVLFGLGVTIGAGIYVLIGATAGRVGMHAPWAFVLAGLVMAPTAASFAELAARIPVSAGEAAYVEVGFHSKHLARIVGLLVVLVGVSSAAAIARGSAGYIRELVQLPYTAILIAVILVMGAIAAWGIMESVAIAALMTVIEIVGLIVIVAVGAWTLPDLTRRLPEATQGIASLPALAGLVSASLLAFFAFIGFESLANLAEEVKEPEYTLPRAIALTLVISVLLYMVVVWVALVAVPRAELAASSAPLSLVYRRVTGASATVISAIAIVATINGIIAQMVMTSRVIYGLADRKQLPSVFASVSPVTQTPLLATACVVGVVVLLAIAFPIEALAEATSRMTLVIFAIVNAALVALKRGGPTGSPPAFTVPVWVPMLGAVLCIGLLAAGLIV